MAIDIEAIKARMPRYKHFTGKIKLSLRPGVVQMIDDIAVLLTEVERLNKRREVDRELMDTLRDNISKFQLSIETLKAGIKAVAGGEDGKDEN